MYRKLQVSLISARVLVRQALEIPIAFLTLFGPDSLYRNRHTFWPWLFAIVMSFGAGAGSVYAFEYFGILASRTDLLGKGSTAVLAFVAAPIAWYLWLIRDRNRLEQLKQEASHNARDRFNKLREWVSGEAPGLQINAVFELGEYLDPSSRSRRLPEIIASEQEKYADDVRVFFQGLLRNRRSWDSVETMTFRSALEAAIRLRGLYIHDFSEADLQGLLLSKAFLTMANFSFANLERAQLAAADLAGATFNNANLEASNLDAANLEGAHFVHTNLKGANLSRAKMGAARIIPLKPDSLDDANFTATILTGLRVAPIVLEMRHDVDWEGRGARVLDLEWKEK